MQKVLGLDFLPFVEKGRVLFNPVLASSEVRLKRAPAASRHSTLRLARQPNFCRPTRVCVLWQ